MAEDSSTTSAISASVNTSQGTTTTGSTTTLESSTSTSTSTSTSASVVTSSTSTTTSTPTSSHSSQTSAKSSTVTASGSLTATQASSTSNTSTSKSSSSDSTTSNTASMPKITAIASDSVSSALSSSILSDSSSHNVTFSAVVPTGYNPFVSHETSPNGLTFIIIGAIMGAFLVSLIVARFFYSSASNRAAKKSFTTEDKFTHDYNYDPSIFKDTPAKQNYSHSIYSLSSQSTLNVLGSTASMENLITHHQGRSYTSTVTRASRTSLFISPTEMLALGNHNPQQGGYLSNYNSPIESPTTISDPNSSRDFRRKTNKPPSMYMEKMLDEDLDDVSSSDSLQFEEYADEKV